MHETIYVRYIERGESWVKEHRVWNAALFREHLQAQNAHTNIRCQEITERQFNQENKS